LGCIGLFGFIVLDIERLVLGMYFTIASVVQFCTVQQGRLWVRRRWWKVWEVAVASKDTAPID